MDLVSLKDLGNVPFATVTAATLWHLLGPTAKYLGGKTQQYTQKSVENIERIIAHALARIPIDDNRDGIVPPRVLRLTMNEGAFTEDEVASAYLGGVLASSRTEKGRDDRGVSVNGLISRLSVFQLRLHYICYRAAHYLLQGVDTGFADYERITNKVGVGTVALMLGMGLSDELIGDPEVNLDSILTHALYGLNKEQLIEDWEFQWQKGLQFSPSPLGAELFLWANGQGRQSITYFFDHKFEPVKISEDEATIIFGRGIPVDLGKGEELTIDGFDYCYMPSDALCCPIRIQDL